MMETDQQEKLEKQQLYYKNQAKKNQRIADYSLDKDNQRAYQTRTVACNQKADEIGGKIAKSLAKSDGSGIIKIERNVSSRHLPIGLRKPSSHILTEKEIQSLLLDVKAIEADESVFKFNVGYRTGYDDVLDEIRVRGDILPDIASKHPRDMMSSRAALAHEYYGHRAYRGTNAPKGSWNDEFRASYMAAKNCPNLTPEDRRYLILDALERAKESGIPIIHNDFIRRVLYG